MDPIAPMLAVAGEPFDSPEHLFEIKWDGVRALAAVEAGATWRIWGRKCADYTARYPELSLLQNLPGGTVLDGEIVQLADGRADFDGLLHRHQLVSLRKIRWAAAERPVSYVVFDLLRLNGDSLLPVPLWERRQRLAQLVAQAGLERLAFSDGVVEHGWQFYEQVIKQGHEGVMAKCLDSPYLPGKRAATWQQIKPREATVCVIVGYRAAQEIVTSLLLAAQHAGPLRYVGEVSAGLTESVQRELAPLLAASSCSEPLVAVSRPAHWLRPELYCLVQSFGWTGGGKLRHPRFRRLLRGKA